MILGGNSREIFDGSLSTVETFSTKCGLFETELPPLPVARHSFGAAYWDGSIYFCGGYSLINPVKECFKFDLTQPWLGWIQIASMKRPRGVHKPYG